MAINIVPMSTDATGNPAAIDPLVQAMMAQRQRGQSTGERLMEAGSRPQPVFHNAQGMMMLANGALGGFLQGREDRDQKEAQRQAGLAIGQLGRNSGLSEDATRALTALAIINPSAVGPMIAQMSQRMFAGPQAVGRDQRLVDPRTGRVTTDSEPNFQRVGPGETLVDPRQVPRAPAAGAPAPQPSPPAGGQPPAPAVQGSGSARAGAGMQPGVVFQGRGYEDLTTPEARRAAGIQDTDRRPAQRGPDGKLVFDGGAPSTSVTANVNTTANPWLEGLGKQFASQREAAAGAADTIRTLHAARQQMDQGIISGPGADMRLGIARIGAQFGITDPRIVNNTEAFRSAIGQGVLDRAKALGANPSNADREFILGVMGGSIALNEASLRRIIDIQEGMARGAIERYNQSVGGVMENLRAVPGADQQGLAMAQALGPVAMPPPYAPQQAQGQPQQQGATPAPAQPQQAPQQAAPFSLEAIEAEIMRRQQMQQQAPAPDLPQLGFPVP